MLISSEAQKVLKIFHLFAVCFWVGGAVGLMLLLRAVPDAGTDAELFGILKSYSFINVILTVYMGAYGSFFTGLAYSLCTNRGFFRHKWVILKWAMTLGMILFGMKFLALWSNALLEMAAAMGLAALEHPVFVQAYKRLLLASILYFGMFILATILSVYKPWERKELLALQARNFSGRLK